MPQPMLILTNAQQQIRYRFSLSTAAYQMRNRAFQSVTAKYEDQEEAKTKMVTVGVGDPCHTLRKKFKTQDEAAKAARAKPG